LAALSENGHKQVYVAGVSVKQNAPSKAFEGSLGVAIKLCTRYGFGAGANAN